MPASLLVNSIGSFHYECYDEVVGDDKELVPTVTVSNHKYEEFNGIYT